MRQAAVGPYLVERGILTELNGLRVPAHFDCENLCNVSQWESESPVAHLGAPMAHIATTTTYPADGTPAMNTKHF